MVFNGLFKVYLCQKSFMFVLPTRKSKIKGGKHGKLCIYEAMRVRLEK